MNLNHFVSSLLIIVSATASTAASVCTHGFEASPKFNTGAGNPLLDFMYVADPTAVEHNGRIYVYGTNDQQEIDSVGVEKQNSYAYIHSLVMMSSADMVNWTYHGIIDVEKVAPWTGKRDVSWAPSVISRLEDDGKTHFYLYYSHGGGGIGVLTATSPVGPWTDRLGHDIINVNTPGLKDCPAPFDPGAVIDSDGTGWLSFGGGKSSSATALYPGSARIVRLGKDLLSIDSEIAEIPAPYFFEASELNYIDGTWFYSYSTDWVDRDEWHADDVKRPSVCSISYMTSTNPLKKDSWKFRGDILQNAFGYGLSASNNHTHFLKFGDSYYIFYHNNNLADFRGIKTGYRNICVDRLDVNEKKQNITTGTMTHRGVRQIRCLNPFDWQQAETVAATIGMEFEHTDVPGNMVAVNLGRHQRSEIRQVDFGKGATCFEALVAGKGSIDIYVGKPEGKPLASLYTDAPDWKNVSVSLDKPLKGIHDLCFVFRDGEFKFDQWRFVR
ncbi:MAG: family 43 glycosylhydrolase [Duncaniella sp.]|nr:family 43 glycosylhydrolase [Duncaniella sp.]